MLSALNEDLAVDSYLDDQPGGIGTMSQDFKYVDKYENIWDEHNITSVFGDSYTNSSEQKQQAMKYHLTALENIYSNYYPS